MGGGMLRPTPLCLLNAFESDDSGSFGGLADVLEPDPDDDAVTSARGQVLSASLVGVQDFAFADTVFAKTLPGDEAPPSGPVYVNDATGRTQCMTPLAFPLPPAGEGVDLASRLRLRMAHWRHAVRRSRGEMRELWAGTAEMVEGGAGDPRAQGTIGSSSIDVRLVGLVRLVRRVVALWSCFQWSPADLTRAAAIGLAVFVVAAAIGATTIDFGSAAAAASHEVRATRTLDQHTGSRIVIRDKR